jgi:hypothetical protein
MPRFFLNNSIDAKRVKEKYSQKIKRQKIEKQKDKK